MSGDTYIRHSCPTVILHVYFLNENLFYCLSFRCHIRNFQQARNSLEQLRKKDSLLGENHVMVRLFLVLEKARQNIASIWIGNCLKIGIFRIFFLLSFMFLILVTISQQKHAPSGARSLGTRKHNPSKPCL